MKKNKNKMIDPREKLAMRVSRNTILINPLLSAGKLFARLAGRSAAALNETHRTAERVHRAVETSFPCAKHCYGTCESLERLIKGGRPAKPCS